MLSEHISKKIYKKNLIDPKSMNGSLQHACINKFHYWNVFYDSQEVERTQKRRVLLWKWQMTSSSKWITPRWKHRSALV